MTNRQIKFKPRFDGSTWSIIALCVVSCTWPLLLDTSMLMIAILTSCLIICLIPFLSIWYEIDGDELVVYQFWHPSRFPIAKIKEVAPTKTMLAAPATSITHRLAITFTDRKVLKSSTPLIISPANPQQFCATLLSLNPAITIHQ